MKLLILTISIFYSSLAFSSVPLQIPLDKLVANTDHLLTGHVIGVDMIDGNGNQITDLSAKTGPRINNKIRLIIQINETHITNEKIVPNKIAVPLDSIMHYTFGQIKSAHSSPGRKMLVLLKGKNFQPAFAGVFLRGLEEKSKIIQMFKHKEPKGKVDDKKYQSFNSKVDFKCAGMTVGLRDFTVDIDDVPASVGKANMSYHADLDIQAMPELINGKVKDEKFSAGVGINISFGKGNKKRSLPQKVYYVRQLGYSVRLLPIGYDGGVQRFDSILNPDSKDFDIYYDVRCSDSKGDKSHKRFKTAGKVFKMPQ